MPLYRIKFRGRIVLKEVIETESGTVENYHFLEAHESGEMTLESPGELQVVEGEAEITKIA